MRLLIINPNSSLSVTARINASAQAAALPGEEIKTIAATGAPELIVTQSDAAAAELAVTRTLAARTLPADGIILASFGDTGLTAVRTQTRVPVVGIAQSAYAMASVLGPRLSIVSFSPDMAAALRKKANDYGHARNVVAMHMVEGATWDDPGMIQEHLAPQLLALCQKSAREDHVNSIVLGGGPLAGLAARLQAQVSVPIIDGTTAAIATLRVALGSAQPGHAQRVPHLSHG
ncbi:MAG: aspartate/glutamate racemase family protein [Roseinatronobacter sp.]